MYRNHGNAYGDRNTKTKLQKIAESFNVDIKDVKDYIKVNHIKIYNLPPKGSKKERLFISSQDAVKVKRYFRLCTGINKY